MRRTLVLLAVLAVAGSVIHAAAVEPAATSHRVEHGPAATRYVIGAAGDIACQNAAFGPGSPSSCQYDETADLIERGGLSEVLLLGDNQYERGTYAAYTSYFDPTWGRSFANLSPAPGNHEYANDPSSRPGGYFRYFGDRVKVRTGSATTRSTSVRAPTTRAGT